MTDRPGKRFVGMRFEPQLWEALQNFAQAEGRSVSDYVREVLRNHVRRRQSKATAPSADE